MNRGYFVALILLGVVVSEAEAQVAAGRGPSQAVLSREPLRTPAGSEPGWAPQVVLRGEERERLQATPILERPYRPLHFYGNTVRRLHYRGTPLPTVRETAELPVLMTIRRGNPPEGRSGPDQPAADQTSPNNNR